VRRLKEEAQEKFEEELYERVGERRFRYWKGLDPLRRQKVIEEWDRQDAELARKEEEERKRVEAEVRVRVRALCALCGSCARTMRVHVRWWYIHVPLFCSSCAHAPSHPPIQEELKRRTHIYPSGAKYVGDAIKDPDGGTVTPHGFGTYTWASGQVMYEGHWRKGLKEGHGTYHWLNGNSWSGMFSKDKMNGYGVYKAKNGKERGAIYQNGRRTGWIEGVSWCMWRSGALCVSLVCVCVVRCCLDLSVRLCRVIIICDLS